MIGMSEESGVRQIDEVTPPAAADTRQSVMGGLSTMLSPPLIRTKEFCWNVTLEATSLPEVVLQPYSRTT